MEPKQFISKQWFIDARVGNIKDVYHFQERLGSGGFGVVYLAIHKSTGIHSLICSFLINFVKGDKYAVKAIQKYRVDDYETFQNEIKILKTLVCISLLIVIMIDYQDHPNIIKLFEIWEWQ